MFQRARVSQLLKSVFTANRLNHEQSPRTLFKIPTESDLTQNVESPDPQLQGDGFTKQNPASAPRGQYDRTLLRMQSNEGPTFKDLSPEKKRKVIEYNWILKRESGQDLPEEIDEKWMELLMMAHSYHHLNQTFALVFFPIQNLSDRHDIHWT